MQALVDDRLHALRSVLAESIFPPERANMRAAIAGYESGAIAIGTHYTVIWAGRIVDTSPTYTALVTDRPQRLDRYAAEHGPGWLWWEPPLWPDAAVRPMKKGVCLPNMLKHDPDAPGYFKVRMGFRRLRPMVNRTSAGPNATSQHQPVDMLAKASSSSSSFPLAAKPRDNKVSTTSQPSLPPPSRPPPQERVPHEVDPTAPFMFYSCLLDSGASVPCLYASDLVDCGIDPASYAAQSVTTVSSLAARSTRRVYEMEAGVFADDDSTLVDAAVWPAEPTVLGCVTEVLALSDAEKRAVGGSGSGFDLHRLSGMVPFNVAYLAAAPGLGALWLGGDRCDVLGAHRMPGQLRAGNSGAVDAGHPRELWHGLGSPTGIRFEHRCPAGGVLVDEEDSAGDGGVGRSVTTLYEEEEQGEGDGGEGLGGGKKKRKAVRTVRVEPRLQVRQKRAFVKTAAPAKQRQNHRPQVPLEPEMWPTSMFQTLQKHLQQVMKLSRPS